VILDVKRGYQNKIRKIKDKIIIGLQKAGARTSISKYIVSINIVIINRYTTKTNSVRNLMTFI